MNKIKSNVSSNPVSAFSDSSESNNSDVSIGKDKKKKGNGLMAEISKLSAQVSELSSVRDEIQELKKQLADVRCHERPQSGNDSRGSRRRAFKCQNCFKNFKFCNHCFACGSSDHIKKDCPAQKNS